VAVALPDLPKYLVLDPDSTVRLEIRLESPACEIDVQLDNPRPGRSFVLLIGHKNGPFVQRVRLAGRARIYFDPEAPGEYVLLVSNPQSEPIILRLRARDVTATKAPGARVLPIRSKKPPQLTFRPPRRRGAARARSRAKDAPRSS
jgi:hypothetical protein